MDEEGVVVELLGGKALVRLVESGGCQGCAAAGTCKTGAGGREMEVGNPIGAVPGQRVLVKIEGGAFLKASFLVYMVPVIFLFIGAALGGKAALLVPGVMSVDYWQALCGVAFLALSLVVVRFYGKMTKKGSGLRPVITKVLE